MKKTLLNRSLFSLSFWQHKPRYFWKRTIVLLVSLTFLFPYLTWAFEPNNYPKPKDMILVGSDLLQIPDKLGQVVETFQGQKLTVIHIQDLHCNYEVQTNISHLIDYLAKKHNLRLVAIEGASLPVNVTKLSTFPLKTVRSEVGDYFVRQGKISGAEYYAANGECPIYLEGIETPAHYQAGRKLVMSFLTDENQGYVWDLRESLEQVKKTVYSPALLKFDSQRRAFHDGQLSLLKYAQFLSQQAEQQRLALTGFPQVSRYLANYSAPLSKEIDSDDLFQQLERLDIILRESFYTQAEQRVLDQLVHRLDILEKMLNISASPQEVGEYLQAPQNYQVQMFQDFIQGHDLSGAMTLGPEIYQLDDFLQKAKQFYLNADLRSRDFINNLFRRMQKHQVTVAVLVTGGYHTPQLVNQFKAKNISFISVKPVLIHQDLLNPYFSLLKNRTTPLERLLAQNQKIMALEPFFAQIEQAFAILNEQTDLPEEVRLSYRVLETILKLESIYYWQAKGIKGLEALQAKYEQTLADYPAAGRMVIPDIRNGLAGVNALLVRLGGPVFAVLGEREKTLFNPQAVQQSITINQMEISFFNNDQLGTISQKLREAGQTSPAYSLIRTQLIQAMMPAGALVVNGTKLLTSRTNLWYNFFAKTLGRLKFSRPAWTRGWPNYWNNWKSLILAGLKNMSFRWSAIFPPGVTAGAMGKIKIDQIIRVSPQQLVVVGERLADHQPINLLLDLRTLSKEEANRITQAVQRFEKINVDPAQAWYQNDHAVLQQLLQNAQSLQQASQSVAQSLEDLHGFFAITRVQMIQAPPGVRFAAGQGMPAGVELAEADMVFEGLGLPETVLLDETLIQSATSDVFQAAFLHELGESLPDARLDHQALRGLGKQARQAKSILEPEEIGFVGRILGNDNQEALTQWISDRKFEHSLDRIRVEQIDLAEKNLLAELETMEKSRGPERVRLAVIAHTVEQQAEARELGFQADESFNHSQAEALGQVLRQLTHREIAEVIFPAQERKRGGQVVIRLVKPQRVNGGLYQQFTLFIRDKKIIGQPLTPRAVLEALKLGQLGVQIESLPVLMRLASSQDKLSEQVMAEDEWEALQTRKTEIQAAREQALADEKAKTQAQARQVLEEKDRQEKTARDQAEAQAQARAKAEREQKLVELQQAFAARLQALQTSEEGKIVQSDPWKSLREAGDSLKRKLGLQGLDFHLPLMDSIEEFGQLIGVVDLREVWEANEKLRQKLKTLPKDTRFFLKLLDELNQNRRLALRKIMLLDLFMNKVFDSFYHSHPQFTLMFNQMILYYRLLLETHRSLAGVLTNARVDVHKTRSLKDAIVQQAQTEETVDQAAVPAALTRMQSRLEEVAATYAQPNPDLKPLADTLGREYQRQLEIFKTLDPALPTFDKQFYYAVISLAATISCDWNLTWFGESARDPEAYQIRLTKLIQSLSDLYEATGVKGMDMFVVCEALGLRPLAQNQKHFFSTWLAQSLGSQTEVAFADLGAGPRAEFGRNLRQVLEALGKKVVKGISVDHAIIDRTAPQELRTTYADVTNPQERRAAGLEDESLDLVTINNIINAYFLAPAVGLLKTGGRLMITFAASDEEDFKVSIKETVEKLAAADPRLQVMEMERPLDYPQSNQESDTPYRSDQRMLVVVKKVLEKAGPPETKSQAGFEFGAPVSKPANRLLQMWRWPRRLAMSLLFSMVQMFNLILAAAGARLARGAMTSRQAKAYLEAQERQYFPLNDNESRRYNYQLVNNEIFETGSLAEKIFGSYSALDLQVGIKIFAPLVEAANPSLVEGNSPARNSLLKLRAKLAQRLIQQIYYYRSAEYYGLTLGARMKIWLGISGEQYTQRQEALALALFQDLMQNLSPVQDSQMQLLQLQAFARAIQRMPIAKETIWMRYAGQNAGGRKLNRLRLPLAITRGEKIRLLQHLEHLQFTIEERQKYRLLPHRFRLSLLSSA